MFQTHLLIGKYSTDTVLSIGGISDTFTSTTAAAVIVDTTPNSFSFTDQTDTPLSTVISSNFITVAGIDSPASISITDGTYSINGGAFISTTSTVSNGDTVQVQHTSSSSVSTTIDTVLTIGGISDTFTSTTLSTLPDAIPDAFSFTDQTAVSLSTAITSATITVSGINSPASIIITGGTFSINGGTFSGTTSTVSNGDTILVQHTSSSTASTAIDTVLSIGGISDTFTSTTEASSVTTESSSGSGSGGALNFYFIMMLFLFTMLRRNKSVQ